MRILMTALFVTIAFLPPRTSQAEVFELVIGDPPDFDFGRAGASFSGSFFEILLDGLAVEVEPGVGGSFTGEFQFHTDSLLDLSLTDDGDFVYSRYSFGPGTVTIPVHWADESGDHEGTYSGELLGLTIDLCEAQLSVDVCDPVWGDSAGFAFADFGAGAFDPALARALRVAEGASIFGLGIDIDGVTGEPESRSRSAFFQLGSATAEIAVEPIPEPQITALLVVSLLGVLGRRRMARK